MKSPGFRSFLMATKNTEEVEINENAAEPGYEDVREGGESEVVEDLPPPAGETENPTPREKNAPPPYEPNFKYKVLKEEKEIPEWARPLVTTPEMEKSVRE